MPLKIVKKIKVKPIPICPPEFADISDPMGHGQRAVDFLRSLKHPKSTLKDQAFQLDPWQEKIVRQIYGPRHPDGTRVVKTAFVLIPRGARKTSLGAALALLHTMGPEAVPGGEVLTAAADRKQAKIAFNEADGIIGAGDADLWRKGQASRRFDAGNTIKRQEYKNRITFPNGSFIEALSNDAGTQHGRTPAFALADELHAWKKPELWTVIKTGLVKTPGSLLVVITTAGRGQENLAFKITEYARKVAAGDLHDPSFLPVLFEASPDEDWEDEAIWHRVNPGMTHGYPDLAGMRQLAREAKERPADREAFKQLHLNMWSDHSHAPFVDMPVYDEGSAPVVLADLEQEPCWLGVDLSSTDDMTAVVAAWRDPDKEDGFIVYPWYFIPEANIARRTQQSGYPYDEWVGAGLVWPTPGDVIDLRAVEDHVRDLCDRFQVREIAADPYMAQAMLADLTEDGLPAFKFRQGMLSMAPAVRELEIAIVGRRFRHGGHPVLRWNFSNIAVESDAAGNKKFNKTKARDKIDGAVAAAMAVSRAATGEDTRSIYSSEERAEGLLVW